MGFPVLMDGSFEEGMVGAEGFEPTTLCSQSRSGCLLKSVEFERN